MAERIKRNTSKIEVLANKNEIDNLLEAEFPISLIWKTLQNKGKITCKYHAFLKSVKKICKKGKYIENNTLKEKQRLKNQKEQPQEIQNSQQGNEQRHHAELQKKSSFILEGYNPIEDDKKENN